MGHGIIIIIGSTLTELDVILIMHSRQIYLTPNVVLEPLSSKIYKLIDK